MKWLVLVFSGGAKGPVVYFTDTEPARNSQDFGVLYINGSATLYSDYESYLTNTTPTTVHDVRIVGPHTVQGLESQ